MIWARLSAIALLLTAAFDNASSRCHGGTIRRKVKDEAAMNGSRLLASQIFEEAPFVGKLNSSCRRKSGDKGIAGDDFERVTDVTLEECMMQCQESFKCAGYEYTMKESKSEGDDSKVDDGGDDSVCHLWNHYGPGSQKMEGRVCFWKQTACCEPPPSKCNKKMEPIKCGPQDCEYQNYCLAESAGWDREECTKRCLKPADPDVCNDEEFNPVRCGNKQFSCDYDNLCLAKEAGFSADACRLTCDYEKNPGCVVACTLDFRPVACGQNQCIFDNLCSGTKAFGFKENQCADAEVEAEEKTPNP